MPGVQLAIFDCDGVLVDSERLAVGVDMIILERVGWPLTYDEVVERFVGRPHSFMVSEIEAHVDGLPDGWVDEYRPLYEAAFAADLVAVEGIAAALDLVTVPTCVASSGTHRDIRRSLELTGLRDRFGERIFSVEDVARAKPAPDVFLFAADRMGTAPSSCVVVEDSVHGVNAARAAGMRVLAYGGGLAPAAKLAGPATTVFGHMRELPGLLAAFT